MIWDTGTRGQLRWLGEHRSSGGTPRDALRVWVGSPVVCAQGCRAWGQHCAMLRGTPRSLEVLGGCSFQARALFCLPPRAF